VKTLIFQGFVEVGVELIFGIFWILGRCVNGTDMPFLTNQDQL